MSEISKSVINGNGDKMPPSTLGENMARLNKHVNNDYPTGSSISIQPNGNRAGSKSPKRPLNTESSVTEGSSDSDTDEERQIKVRRGPLGAGRDTPSPDSANTVQGKSENLYGKLSAEQQSLAALCLAEINRKLQSVSWKP